MLENYDNSIMQGPDAKPEEACRPTYDYSQWPVFVVTMPPVLLSSEVFRDHLTACEEPFTRGEPFSWLIDLRDAPPMPPTQRKALGELMNLHAARYPGQVRGVALVVKTTLERGIITAINWIARPVYPHAVFESLDEAHAWVNRAAQPAGRRTSRWSRKRA